MIPLLTAVASLLISGPDPTGDLARTYRVCAEGGPANASRIETTTIPGGVRARNRETGLAFEVLYDDDASAVALRCLPYLDALYGETARLAAVDPASTRWHGVVFNATGELPDQHGERWPIKVTDGTLDEEARRRLASVLPHEQTHAAVRMTPNARTLPRWYREGVASWVEQTLLAATRPDLAQARAARFDAALVETPGLALKDWGPLRLRLPSGGGGPAPRIVNGQMVMQAAPADAETVKTEMAQYGAALKLIQWMEAEAGRDAVTRWIAAVAAAPTPPDTPELIRLARVHADVDLTSRLD